MTEKTGRNRIAERHHIRERVCKLIGVDPADTTHMGLDADDLHHLGRIGTNRIQLTAAVEYWNDLGDTMHSRSRDGYTSVYDPEDCEAGIAFLPDGLRFQVTDAAERMTAAAYGISGHYRRELDRIEKYCADTYGDEWPAVLSLSAEFSAMTHNPAED